MGKDFITKYPDGKSGFYVQIKASDLKTLCREGTTVSSEETRALVNGKTLLLSNVHKFFAIIDIHFRAQN